MKRPRVHMDTRVRGDRKLETGSEGVTEKRGPVESSGQHSEGLTAVPAPGGQPACSGPALDPLPPALTFTYAGSLAATV